MPSACGSRSCLCQSVSRAGNHCRARRGGYHPPEAFPPLGGRWMAEGQTDEGFPRSHAWVPLAGRACPAGAPISSRRNGGKEGSGASPPEPPKRGLMAAVGCVWLAKTRRALPPALSALTSQALPRPGWHASGLPCKPRKLLRCTNLARRAAIGAMPLKYHGGRGNCPWGATTRRALGGSPADRRPQVAPTGGQSLTLTNRGRMISAPTGTTVTAPGRAGHSAELHAALHAHGLDAGQGRPKAARRFGNPTSFSRWGN